MSLTQTEIVNANWDLSNRHVKKTSGDHSHQHIEAMIELKVSKIDTLKREIGRKEGLNVLSDYQSQGNSISIIVYRGDDVSNQVYCERDIKLTYMTPVVKHYLGDISSWETVFLYQEILKKLNRVIEELECIKEYGKPIELANVKTLDQPLKSAAI